MKQELVAPFTLQSLLIAEKALLNNPELKVTFLSSCRYGYNEALAIYDYSRTVEDLGCITVVLCGDQINLMHMVALAAFNPENRVAMDHVTFKQSRLSGGAYGNQQDIISGREYLSQVKTACVGILAANYEVDNDFHEVDKPACNAVESGFFSKYTVGSAIVADLPVEQDESNIVTSDGDF